MERPPSTDAPETLEDEADVSDLHPGSDLTPLPLTIPEGYFQRRRFVQDGPEPSAEDEQDGEAGFAKAYKPEEARELEAMDEARLRTIVRHALLELSSNRKSERR